MGAGPEAWFWQSAGKGWLAGRAARGVGQSDRNHTKVTMLMLPVGGVGGSERSSDQRLFFEILGLDWTKRSRGMDSQRTEAYGGLELRASCALKSPFTCYYWRGWGGIYPRPPEKPKSAQLGGLV